MKRKTTINWELLNRADYENPGVIKTLLRHLDDLINCATRGDSVAHSIYIDLVDAVENVSTPKPGFYLQQWLDGYSQDEIAVKHQVSRQAVNIAIHRITKNISNYLL
jgi:DNA-directed RNA polymerase specialized sigma24 family protein